MIVDAEQVEVLTRYFNDAGEVVSRMGTVTKRGDQSVNIEGLEGAWLG